jgi:hypothetical protein
MKLSYNRGGQAETSFGQRLLTPPLKFSRERCRVINARTEIDQSLDDLHKEAMHALGNKHGKKWTALEADDFPLFVNSMRGSSPYIAGHRGCTFVIVLPSEVRGN